MFQDHPIFYWKHFLGKHSIITFRNDFLRAEEENDFLRHNSNVKESAFAKARERMGTITVITGLRVSGEIVYEMLKSRTEIEQSYDTFKNTIHADRSYMRDDHQLQGWMFINFIALMMHYRIYATLKSRDMQRKYSPGDVLVHLERVNRLRIGDEWKTSEIPRKSGIIIDSLDIPIM